MVSQVEIASELVRLAQERIRKTRTPLATEIARLVALDAVVDLDPEAGLIVQSNQAWSDNDQLVASLGVNDIVVNGMHIDVRPLDADGQVTILRSLVGTSYLTGGSLAVSLTGVQSGRVVAFISPEAWQNADQDTKDASQVQIKVSPETNFNLLSKIQEQAKLQTYQATVQVTHQPDQLELAKFIQQRNEITIARQRQIVETVMQSPSVCQQLEKIGEIWSNGTLARVLNYGSVWYARVNKISQILGPKFSHLSTPQIRQQVMQTGERYGGQPESPLFKQALLKSLAREEMLVRFQGFDLKRINAVMDKVFSGESMIESVRDLARNKVALDLAMVIKNQREKLADFVLATSDEIGQAFQQLSLKPAYAVHSGQAPGPDAVNEALAMLSAGELAEDLQKLFDEIA